MSNDSSSSSTDYRFSFGPWNIHEGADPFGPTVRPTVEFAKKLKVYRELGFEGVQFHDDDAVPDVDRKSAEQVAKEAREMKKLLADHGLVAEFTAPRLWEDARGVDGGFTSNHADVRRWAVDRTKRCIDIARELGIKFVVLWLAREGTYIREAKNAIDAHKHLLDSLNALLQHDREVEIAIEPKPNEPMDHAYIPTIGHALYIGSQTVDPKHPPMRPGLRFTKEQHDTIAILAYDMARRNNWDMATQWWRTPLGRECATYSVGLYPDRIQAARAAEILGIGPSRVYQLLHAGKLVHHPDGGVTRASVMRRVAHQRP